MVIIRIIRNTTFCEEMVKTEKKVKNIFIQKFSSYNMLEYKTFALVLLYFVLRCFASDIVELDIHNYLMVQTTFITMYKSLDYPSDTRFMHVLCQVYKGDTQNLGILHYKRRE